MKKSGKLTESLFVAAVVVVSVALLPLAWVVYAVCALFKRESK